MPRRETCRSNTWNRRPARGVGSCMTTSAFGGGGPTPGMPGLRLTTDEVEAIVAYLLEQPSG